MPTDKAENLHTSVLLAETLEMLNPDRGGIFVDATLGLGGHTEAILSGFENTRVVGIDQDDEAIHFARRRLNKFGKRIRIVKANFSDLGSVLREFEMDEVDGIIGDFGVSSLQFDSPARGFSFRFDAPLDMRMDGNDEELETAAELLERLDEFEIARIIYEYGEERASRRIARRIVEKRKRGKPVQTTGDLVGVIEKAVGRKKKKRIHPATRTFQALRIAVNGELEILEDFIRTGVGTLKKDGRMVLISFHSLEDRIVKRTFRNLAGRCSCPPRLPVCVCGAKRKIEILTRKPLVPAEKELNENPRARSAKLRACQKL